MDFEKAMNSFGTKTIIYYLVIYYTIFFTNLLITFKIIIMQNKFS